MNQFNLKERPPITQQVTFLYTTNLLKTANFYQNVLKLPLILDQGTCYIYQVSTTSFIGFCQQDTPPTSTINSATQNVIFTIVTPAVDEWYAYLHQQGVEFEKPPAFNPKYNIYHCFLRDPNDYLIEIQTFLDPTWPKN